MAMAEWGTVQYQIINERRGRRLNYDKIDMATLTKKKITKQMSGFIKKNMVGNIMVGEILDYWLQDDNQEWIEETNLDGVESREEEPRKKELVDWIPEQELMEQNGAVEVDGNVVEMFDEEEV